MERRDSLLSSLRGREVGLRSCCKRKFLDLEGCISRLHLKSKFVGHRGCVNTVEFNGDGSLLVSGSDDTTLKIWDSNTYRMVGEVETGHLRNIFCAKFIPNTNDSQLISCGADGEIRWSYLHRPSEPRYSWYRPSQAQPSLPSGTNDLVDCDSVWNGGKILLEQCRQMALKLEFLPDKNHCFIATSKDINGVRFFDLRTFDSERPSAVLLGQQDISGPSDLCFDPTNPNLFALGCEDPVVRVFDIRFSKARGTDSKPKAVQSFAPAQLMASVSRSGFKIGEEPHTEGVSGLDYSRKGEIVATYRSSDLYLFDTRDYHPEEHGGYTVSTKFAQKYQGHHNHETFLKEAKFIGGERYVATGSDCGHLYVYEKLSGKLARIIRADSHVVNGLAPHPYLPLVATCGIDSDVKIFDLGEEFANMSARKQPPDHRNRQARIPMRMRQSSAIVTVQEGQELLQKAAALRTRGNSAFTSGRIEEAVSTYKECVEILDFQPPTEDLKERSQSVMLLCKLNLAACRLKLKEWAEAQDMCSAVLALDSKHIKALYRRAQARIELHDFEGAKQDLDLAATIDPENQDVKRLLADMQKKKDIQKLKERKAFAKMFK